MGGMSGGQRVDEDLLVGRISLKVGYASPRLVLGIVVGVDVADAIGRVPSRSVSWYTCAVIRLQLLFGC
jgi:hypothetical protein